MRREKLKQVTKAKRIVVTAVSVALIGIGINALAHTRLDIPTMTEGSRTINHLVGHTCGSNKAIGFSVVFPDGVDSSVLVNGQPHTGALTDFVEGYGNNAQLIFDRSQFDLVDEKMDPSGANVVGFWGGGGPGVPSNLTVATRFRLTAPTIVPTSCAKTVKAYISIAVVCQVTGTDQFGAEGVVDLWTPNNLGTPFDSVEAGADAPWTINRDLTKSPLPESCGAGVDVEIRPSAAQINRDMPVKINGQQVWPK